MSWDLRTGDCLDPVTGLASLADKSIDHVICDPPFEAEAHTLQRRVKREGGVMEVKPLDFAPITEETRIAASAQIARVAKGWILVFCQVEAAVSWKQALEASGAVYKRTCIWVKPDGMPQYSGDRPGMGYETIVACHAPGRSKWNGGGQHGVFVSNKIGPDDVGETVLDPFAGSGTTGIACVRNGGAFIGWERDPKYHAAAVKRLQIAREQLALFGGAA